MTCACPDGQASCDPREADCTCAAGDPGSDGTPAGDELPPAAAPSGAPLGLKATSVAPGAIDLFWRSVPDAAMYRVYRDGALVATVSAPRYEDTSLSPATAYVYEVTAVTESGESPRSEPARATTHLPDADGDVVAGSLSSAATMQSIGFEWAVGGDPDHDARATVRYRAVGAAAWRQALPLVRVDMNGQNMLAGSILFLDPGTTYEVVLYLTDPDGGARTLRLTAKTRPMPSVAADGRTFHVVPGSGGGDGSAVNPFRGVAAAAAAARPGDVMLLHAGRYGGRISFGVAGQPGRPVVWKAAGDGDPVFDGVEVRASYTWLEGLRIEAGGGYDFPIGVRTAGAPTGVVISRCTIVGNHYAIWLTGGGSDWYIADNVIVGDNTVASGSFSGEGVELQHTSGHVVAHNRISRVGDGVSYCTRNCDIYGNDIFDTSDDGIETDGGYANIRMWENRLHNTGHNGISFQPMNGAPWYIIRNQLIGFSESALKFRGADRFVFLHNTVVNWSRVIAIQAHEMLNAMSRNNVWISVAGGTVWDLGTSATDWRTDLDHDGFDWAGASSPFRFRGMSYRDVGSFAQASGQEKAGVALSHACFPSLTVPGAPPASVPPQVVDLAPGCPAVDAGAILPNINDRFRGAAPDLGAYEQGEPPPRYGPR